jgi:predicted benzoate:H+ symporter BenE
MDPPDTIPGLVAELVMAGVILWFGLQVFQALLSAPV